MKNPISVVIPSPFGNKLLSEKTKNSLLIRNLIFSLLLAMGSYSALAQAPVANFTSNITEGCANLSVRFTDQSTNSPTVWRWDFGNGQLSNQRNPTVTYTTPGVYTVRLTVENANGVNGIVRTNYITVFPSASIGISVNKTVSCLPAEINFRNGVTMQGPGNISSYLWDFGDGTTSTEPNPQKVYTSLGFFTVRLTVTTDAGCVVTSTRPRLIRTIAGITPNFDFSRIDACNTPIGINFNNQTTGPGTLTYQWSLGNGNSSTDRNPTTSYIGTGDYNISLKVASSFGCTDSLNRTITIQSNEASFEIPESVCPNKEISFVNTSNPAPLSSSWDFGDGTFSIDPNPSKVYINTGTYTIRLTNQYSDCQSTTTKTITVANPPGINFSTQDTSGCEVPHQVTFQSSGTGITNRLWDFGDGTTSTEANPIHTYTSFGQYTIQLTTITSDGCTAVVTKPDYIKLSPPVQAQVINGNSGGCVPFTYSPQINAAAAGEIVSYQWDFGTGATSTSPTPTYIYSNTGTYTLRLTVVTRDGCTQTITYPNGIKVGTKPTVDFSVSKNTGCASDTLQFTSFASPADEWRWIFGDGGSSSVQNPAYRFQDTGFFTVQLIAFNNGCADTARKTDYINVSGPVARFNFTPSCFNRLNVAFEDNSILDPSQGVATYFWDFGDGQTSTQQNPVISYSSYGAKNVSLTITDPICSYTKSAIVHLFNLVNDFSVSKPIVCRNEVFSLTAIGTAAEFITSYTWQIEGSAPVSGSRNFQSSIKANGVYDVTLTITDIYGCTSTRTINDLIRVIGATADFSVTNNGGCVNSAVSITDQSNPSGSITKWDFNFGDGTTQSFTSTPFTHVYNNPGSYTIKLTTTDIDGCIDTISKQGSSVISRPLARFGAGATRLCPDTDLAFRDSSIGNSLSYQWNFGDGNISTDKNPIHRYAGPDSTYTVRLIVTDGLGCVDTLIRTDLVQILSPIASFTMEDTSAICPPLETRFQSFARNYDSLYWDFGDGNTSNLENTNNFYNTFGSYTPRLIAIGPGGCRDTASGTVRIYNTSSDLVFNYDPTENCNRITVNFNVIPPPDTKYYLIFDDGSVDSSQANNISHTYGFPNFYRPLLRLVDSLNCEVLVGNRPTIMVKGIIPAFNTDVTEFCDTATINVSDFSIGNDNVTLRRWDFGDGTPPVFNQIRLGHSYNLAGQYIVTQYVTTETGCENTYTDTVRVYRTPQPIISGPDEICLFELLDQQGSTLVADSATIWSWNFGNGQLSNSKDVMIRYTNSGETTISLTASVPFGCSGTTTKNITVRPLPRIENIPEVAIPLGFETTLPITYSDNITQYTWTPSDALSCTNCPTPVANPKFTTNYRVTVVDANGCRASSNIVVRVICENRNYFIPNTFSPNNDGQNDVFYPRGRSLDRIQSMRIFNRWGEMVFERKNFAPNAASEGWNGMIRGQQAASDAYVYIIEVVCENGQVVALKGNVTLIR